MTSTNDTIWSGTVLPVPSLGRGPVQVARIVLAEQVLRATGDVAPLAPGWKPTQEQSDAVRIGLDMLGIGQDIRVDPDRIVTGPLRRSDVEPRVTK